MSMFTLAISCLTAFNLPWFMDLTLQVPMQYCSLQHRTLLLSPVPSTTGCCFCSGSIPSFFLELSLHWSPVAYWAPTDLGSSPFNILSFLPFHTVHGALKARILKWFATGPQWYKTRNQQHKESWRLHTVETKQHTPEQPRKSKGKSKNIAEQMKTETQFTKTYGILQRCSKRILWW